MKMSVETQEEKLDNKIWLSMIINWVQSNIAE